MLQSQATWCKLRPDEKERTDSYRPKNYNMPVYESVDRPMT